VVKDLGALALEPPEPPPQRRLHLALHRVGLVAGHPSTPLHLRVAEAPHAGSAPSASAFPARAAASAPHAPLLPPRRRGQRQRVSRRRWKVRRRSRGVDLDPPVAAGAGARESVVLGEGWGEVAVVGVRGGRGGEVAVGVREGRVRRGGRRRAEVAPVGAVVVTHGRWWFCCGGGG
jgi:hypothetical protein